MEPGLEDAIARTQETLGKVINRPPMTAKLLKRPPFRFLHDCVGEVIRATGCYDGLFSAAELESDNVSDKKAKVTFLQKVIDATSFALGRTVEVRASKIVAGAEAEKTNSLLQAIGEVGLGRVDTTEAVARVQAGETSKGKKASKEGRSRDKPKTKASEESAAVSAASASRSKDRDKEGGRSRESGSRDKPRRSASKDGRSKSGSRRDGEGSSARSKSGARRERADRSPSSRDKGDRPSRSKDKGRDRDRERERRRDGERGEDRERRSKRKHREHRDGEQIDGQRRDDSGTEEAAEPTAAPEDAPVERRARPSSARPGTARRGRRLPPEPAAEDGGDAAPAAAAEPLFPDAPATAHDAGLEQEGAHEEAAAEEEEEQLPSTVKRVVRQRERPSSARPAPPRRKRGGPDEVSREAVDQVAEPVHVIGDEDAEEEEDLFVVDNDGPSPHAAPQPPQDNTPDDGEDGALMRRIKEKKAETASEDIDGTARVNEEAQRKEREQIEKEITVLRGAIQTLCQSANPLGKIIDYMQEDVDSMRKELQMWRDENSKHALTMTEESSATDNTLLPLRSQLRDLDQQIEDQEAMIRAMKASTSEKDQQIERMLSSVAFAARA